MKLNLPNESLEEVLLTQNESEIADAIINEAYFVLDENERNRVKEYIHKGMKPSDAYRKVVLSHLDEDAKEDYASVQVGFGFEEITPLDPKEYTSNPYYQKVMGSFKGKKKIGPWLLEVKRYEPYELFVYDEVRPSPLINNVEYSPLGYFEDGFDYPALSKSGRVYMSLIPHEFHTMEQAIKEAKGNVVTLGLGMGYFAFMASNKEEVASVTILERDDAVISLFKEVFLPLFDRKEKIHILRVNDALTYVPKEPFDYAFADIHHDAVDGLIPYISLLKNKDLSKEMSVWIERAILTYFRRHVVALLEEESQGYGDEAYQEYDDDSTRALCSLHFHLKNVTLNSEDDLIALLDSENLRKIAQEMKLR